MEAAITAQDQLLGEAERVSSTEANVTGSALAAARIRSVRSGGAWPPSFSRKAWSNKRS
jgi:hypothetical protein